MRISLRILLIAFLTIKLPSAYQQLQAAFATIHPELEDASRILGATRLQSLRQITAPLLRTGVIATWCLIFIGVMRELSAAIVLFTANQGAQRLDLRSQRKRRPRRDIGAGHRDAGHHLRSRAGSQPDPYVRRQRRSTAAERLSSEPGSALMGEERAQHASQVMKITL
jgi:Binding-protein-dependent transport system inner membrane component